MISGFLSYPVMGAPPSSIGSFHSRSMWFSLQSVMSGAEGGIGGPNGSLAVMGFRDSRLSDSPSGLTALILNLYW